MYLVRTVYFIDRMDSYSVCTIYQIERSYYYIVQTDYYFVRMDYYIVQTDYYFMRTDYYIVPMDFIPCTRINKSCFCMDEDFVHMLKFIKSFVRNIKLCAQISKSCERFS